MKLLNKILNRMNPPTELLENTSDKILHLSDTPSQIYPEICSLISLIRPTLILHTGDVSDDIKLELYPNQIDLYDRNIKRLSRLVNRTQTSNWHISLGNHDNEAVLKKYFKTALIFSEFGIIDTSFGKIGFSHYDYWIPNIDIDIRCFGHNPTKESHLPYQLNGLEAIYVIQTSPFKIYEIRYPLWTNDYRKKTMKMGF